MGFGDQPLANQVRSSTLQLALIDHLTDSRHHPQFGCFATHLKMMVQMMQNDDDHALILEDDVDFEWTFRDTWRELFPSLKNNWAIVCVALFTISSLIPCLAPCFPSATSPTSTPRSSHVSPSFLTSDPYRSFF